MQSNGKYFNWRSPKKIKARGREGRKEGRNHGLHVVKEEGLKRILAKKAGKGKKRQTPKRESSQEAVNSSAEVV